MKGIIAMCAALACSGVMMAQTPKLNANNIEDVIKAMTLEEKATLVVGTGMGGFTDKPVIGSSSSIVPGAAGTTAPIPRLGIPSIVLSDGPAGVRINPERQYDHKKYYATHFPIGTALACSWNTTLVSQIGTAIGQEASDYGVNVMLSPGVCLMRNPLCGRNFEYYSEDPVLSGNIAAAYISGIQSQGVGTSIKHFAFNNQETQRMGNDAHVSQRAARELYLKNFEIAIRKAQPWTVMSSYNLVNGTLASDNYDLLTTILRGDWGFKGLVMTDWFGGIDPVRKGGKANREATIHAGNDLIEPGQENDAKDIVAAVKNGQLSEKDLDTCVRRVLQLVVKTKRFAGKSYNNNPDLAAHAKVTRQAAAEGAVLLKNNSALPFNNVKNVALYGCGSYDLIAGGTGSGNVNRAYTISLVEGLRTAGYHVDETLLNEYTPYIDDYYKKNPKPGPLDLRVPTLPSEKNVTVTDDEVKDNDIAVITLHRISGEGADRTIAQYNLEQNEKDLIKNVSNAYHKAGKKVVVILNIGGAIETASWKDEPDAILVPWQCGQEIGNSIADLLSGKATPSGKLSMTWPVKVEDDPSTVNFPANTSGYDINSFQQDASKVVNVKNVGYTNYDEDIYVGYRYYDTFKKNVSYPFGYGLSYTTFRLTPGSSPKGEGSEITLSVNVTNTGKKAGKEVVEVYVSAPKGAVEKPAQELKAFAKTKELQPGESQTLTMKINKSDLASFNTKQSAWVVDTGTYTFKIGTSSRDIKYTQTLNIKGSKQKVHNALAPKVKLNLLTQK